MRENMKNSDRYIESMNRWVRFMIREPNGLLSGSLWFLLTCLPIVTIGPARLALAHYMHNRESGCKVSWRSSAAFAFRECGARGWIMGASDIASLILAVGCLLFILEESVPFPVRLVYAFFFVFDVLYLLSGIFRYAALAGEGASAKSGLIMLRGFLMALNNIGWTLMLSFASLLALLISAATGVGLVALYPAAAEALGACAYDVFIEKYKASAESSP